VTAGWYGKAFGSHYPLLYQHRDKAEAQQCLKLLNRLLPLPHSQPILDLGCGDGRHLQLLSRKHFLAFGLDLSPDLLKLAAGPKGQDRLSLMRGDMRQIPLKSGSLGAVLSLFTAFGYFGTLKENGSVMQEVVRVLSSGGHWYLDYVDCLGVRRELRGQEPAIRQRVLGPLLVEETRHLRDAERRVEKDVHLRPVKGQEEAAASWGIAEQGITYTESIALFELEELMAMAQDCGLQMVAQAGSYQGAPLGQGSRWILVFAKETAVRGTP